MANFTERLRQLRDESGKTQSQIAKELGLTPQAFSYFVNGREPNYETLGKIADYFQVSVEYLLGRSDVKTEDPTVREICKFTGLSEKVVAILRSQLEREEKGGIGTYTNFINKLAASRLFPAFMIRLGLYQCAVESLTKADCAPNWVSLDMNSPEMKQKIDAYKRFDEVFKGGITVITGAEQVAYFEQDLADTIEGMLADVSGINYDDPEFIKRKEESNRRWEEIEMEVMKDNGSFESVKQFMDKFAEYAKGEASNDETH